MGLWRDPDLDSIKKRYDRLAPIYPVFEYVFWLPNGVRSYAVSKIELAPGDRVLEVGCGTGRNFGFLIQAVGAGGHIYGVDISKGMLQIARRESVRRGWSNVTLLLHEASEYVLPEPADGALFSFSYEVIPRYREALRWAWSQLRPEGHLVILGQRTPRGVSGKWLRPIGIAVSRATVLGDPDRCPWDDLRELTGQVDFEELRHGYYVCRGTKGEIHTPKSNGSGPAEGRFAK